MENGPFRLKNFTLKEGIYLQFRSEAFNAFKKRAVQSAGDECGKPNFGRLTSALRPRVVQMALRLTFLKL